MAPADVMQMKIRAALTPVTRFRWLTCVLHKCRAEFILDVIGAGATATSTQDWHAIWKSSHEAATLDRQLDEIHSKGRNAGAIRAELRTEFYTSWVYQVRELFKRDAAGHWRNPPYLQSKLFLDVVGECSRGLRKISIIYSTPVGFFVGVTFYHSEDTLQGTQNKLFVRSVSTPANASLMVSFHRLYTWP